MSLQSGLGNFTAKISDSLDSIFASAKAGIENAIGSVKSGFTNVWSGGFSGINENGVSDLKVAIEKYCTDVETIIASFDEAGNISNALKGKINEAAREYIIQVKELLKAYVSNMRQNLRDLDSALEAYQQSAQSVAQNIQSDAQSIRDSANSIRLD